MALDKAFFIDVAGALAVLGGLGFVMARSGARFPRFFDGIGGNIVSAVQPKPVAGQTGQDQAAFTDAPEMGAGYWQAGWFPPNAVPFAVLPNPLAPASVQSIQFQQGQAPGSLGKSCPTCAGVSIYGV